MSQRDPSRDVPDFPQNSAPLVNSDLTMTNAWRTLFTNLWNMAAGSMAQTISVLISPQFLPTSAMSLYSSPIATKTRIDKATATNTTAASLDLTVYIVPSGQSPADSNKVIDSMPIAAHTAYDIKELQDHVLLSGYSIQAYSSVSGMTFAVSGVQLK